MPPDRTLDASTGLIDSGSAGHADTIETWASQSLQAVWRRQCDERRYRGDDPFRHLRIDGSHVVDALGVTRRPPTIEEVPAGPWCADCGRLGLDSVATADRDDGCGGRTRSATRWPVRRAAG